MFSGLDTARMQRNIGFTDKNKVQARPCAHLFPWASLKYLTVDRVVDNSSAPVYMAKHLSEY